MLGKLDQLANRLVELDELLMHPDATSNMDSYRKMTREHAELGPLVALYHSYQEAGNDIATAQEMLGDPDMKEFAQEEIEAAKATMARLERELQTMLLPKDVNDERNIFLEIRAGTGGDESALFAGDLLRMYSRFAERNRWQVAHTVAAGIRVPRAVGDFLILRAVRESGGKAVGVGDPAILAAVDDCAKKDGLLLCPEGGATLAAYRQALRDDEVDEDERVVLFNCATGLKYPMPEAPAWLDRHGEIDLGAL